MTHFSEKCESYALIKIFFLQHGQISQVYFNRNYILLTWIQHVLFHKAKLQEPQLDRKVSFKNLTVRYLKVIRTSLQPCLIYALRK